MKEVTKLLVEQGNILRLGYDYMGYDINRLESIDFHHLIFPHDYYIDIGNDGYLDWNGAPLNHDTSHPYLHVVEKYNFNIFIDITSEIIDQKIVGHPVPKNIRLIDMRLKDFEADWDGEIYYNREGKPVPVIKDQYRKRLSRVR